MKLLVPGSDTRILAQAVSRSLDLLHGPTSPMPATSVIDLGLNGPNKYSVQWAVMNSIPVETVTMPQGPGYYKGHYENLVRTYAIDLLAPDHVIFFLVRGDSRTASTVQQLIQDRKRNITTHRLFIQPDWTST
jgi:hypothetical protein